MKTFTTYTNGYPASLKGTMVSIDTSSCDVTSQEVVL